MPIRFRCAFCNQLMGIARRKAGEVVRCPKCAGQVIVPDPGKAGIPATNPAPQPAGAPRGPALFEQSDFEKMLFPEPSPAPLPGPQQNPAPLSGAYDVEPVSLAKKDFPPGIFLSRSKLAILGGLMLFLLGLAFFIGLWVGRL